MARDLAEWAEVLVERRVDVGGFGRSGISPGTVTDALAAVLRAVAAETGSAGCNCGEIHATPFQAAVLAALAPLAILFPEGSAADA